MSDPRFARLRTDPRFRPLKKQHQKVVIDERFKSVFDQAKRGKGSAKPQVDKYGRKLSKTHEEDNLKRFYWLASDSKDIRAGDVQGVTKLMDYARGEVLMESTDEEGSQGTGEAEGSSRSDVDEILRLGGSEEELDIDLNEDILAELDVQVSMHAKVNEGLEEKQKKQDVGIANRTRRLAVVNLDWEYVRALHLYKIFSCLVSPTAPHIPVTTSQIVERDSNKKRGKGGASPVARGTVVSVRVYPSEFGKARMAKEEREGPPVEIFKKKRKETEEINEKTIYEFGDQNEYNADALRWYQLERLRYYYAIVECDTREAASHIYNQLEGTELERSGNVFDLSFVPEDMTFADEPRDETTEDVSANYKPVDYVTNALRHSKVKLTWDEDDPERHQVTHRILTRQEIDDDVFRAYIASSSEDEPGIGDEDKIRMAKDSSRQKLRTLLLRGNNDALPEGWDYEEGNDVDMEITFTPGLSQRKDEETTLDKYQRKVREKRKRKQERKESEKSTSSEKKDSSSKIQNDDFFGSGSDGDDDGEIQMNVGDNARKKEGRERTFPPQQEATVKELSSLQNVHKEPKHFDMKMVLKAERHGARRGKKDRKDTQEQELQEDFTIDVNDVRFKALHEDHRFAIDPTNPHFKNTKSMRAFLSQRRQKRVRGKERHRLQLQTNNRLSDEGLEGLIESVKRKSQDAHGNSKRRRM